MELLAPGGDADAIKAAIVAGADAVYCGLDKFNARNRATNIDLSDLQGILHLAHQHNCRVFLTLNILMVESEIPALVSLLDRLGNTSIDGLIIQDLGLLYLLSTRFKHFNLHASTQLTTHNAGQIAFLSRLNAGRVNLCRELSILEIGPLAEEAARHDMGTEVFVHGSYCLSFSGLCYISSLHEGNSGNRGRCSQPCRDRYLTTPAGKDYPLNMKDNSAFFDVEALSNARIDSLKIEGRIKKADYVYTVTDAWRKQLDRFYSQQAPGRDNSALYKVFNRDFSNGYLGGNPGREMFIDNPRDHSIQHLTESRHYATPMDQEQDEMALYNEKERIKASVKSRIDPISITRAPLSMIFSGTSGTPLMISVKTPTSSFTIHTEIPLASSGIQPLDRATLLKRFKAIEDTEYTIDKMTLDFPQGDVYLPFRELTALRDRVVCRLNNGRASLKPTQVPPPQRHPSPKTPPVLLVLIDSPQEAILRGSPSTRVCFRLPAALKAQEEEMTNLFESHPALTPWFPPVLIGEDYQAAVRLLHRVKERRVITNNTGIAYQAWKNNIEWIAGPFLNITNSYTLLCLKELFNCSGAFLSGELNRQQLSIIKKPEAFDIFYNLYHPISLMTTRQCLSGRVEGCNKETMDRDCLETCARHSTITNLKGETFHIHKSRGDYHEVFNGCNHLNTCIINDLPGHFTGFMADLRDIPTGTKTEGNKETLIPLFEELLRGKAEPANILHRTIHNTTNHQYKKGI